MILMPGRKGVSPLVATVLLIAFVVAVAGIIATWATSFAKDQTELVQEQSTLSITCGYGKVSMKDVSYSTSTGKLAGTIENKGSIALGTMRLGIVYQNASSQTVDLCSTSSGAVSCSTSNLSLTSAQLAAFNVTIGGANFDSVKLITNCTEASDTLERGDIA